MTLYHYSKTQQLTKPSVITVGSFDGVHLGHQALLQQVNEYARKHHYQSVIITFNPHPQEVLQNKPDFFLINTFEQKIALFEKLGIDNVFVIPFTKELSQTTAYHFFEEYIFSKIDVKAIFIGPNHHFGKQREGDAETLTRLCAEKEVELIMTEEFKVNECKVRSTLIRNYLEQKDWESAEKMMGHDIMKT
ncbi:MAG: FAD synthetase family protein [Bacteroidales bacterium]|jgi:riboflavin kinase/FMN adenylyltransferase|nr:FAD synthetase family protein [Bacteroidales bacterium]